MGNHKSLFDTGTGQNSVGLDADHLHAALDVKFAAQSVSYTHLDVYKRQFFRSIYLWDQIPAGELQAIVALEASHVAHRHSAERVAMECMKAALWWNPVPKIFPCSHILC